MTALGTFGRTALSALAGLSIVVVFPTTSALPADPLGQSGGSLWQDGLVWGVAFSGAGLLALGGILYFLWGGLRHVDRGNVLEHPMRRLLLATIQASPGVHLRDLAARHDTAVTNTQWHLRKLELAGLVKTEKTQGRRLFYPVQGGVESRANAIKNAALRNDNAERLSGYLEAHSGTNQRVLAEALSMNPGTVRWHLRKLEAAGVVRSIQEGAQTHYFLMRTSSRPVRPAARAIEAVAIQQR